MLLFVYILVLDLPFFNRKVSAELVNQNCGTFSCTSNKKKLYQVDKTVYCLEFFHRLATEKIYNVKMKCEIQNAALPLPENKEENQELYKNVREIFGAGFYGLIALQARKVGNKFLKFDKKELTYYNWANGSPSNNLKFPKQFVGKILAVTIWMINAGVCRKSGR